MEWWGNFLRPACPGTHTCTQHKHECAHALAQHAHVQAHVHAHAQTLVACMQVMVDACTHVGEHMYAEYELLAGERPTAHVEIDRATHERQATVEIGGHVEG